MTDEDIIGAINSYFGVDDYRTDVRDPNERYASFDLCYNYFYRFYRDGKVPELYSTENLQTSCLQLGFFLGSWGMFRSSFVRERSVRLFKGTIEMIASSDPRLWEIDVDGYDKESIDLILDCIDAIDEAFGNKATYTLLTKIMLGVYGNVPAFDTNFRSSFDGSTPNEKKLLEIRDFYERHREVLDSIEIRTLDFAEGKLTDIRYPKIKLIDMYGFITGRG